ncbi:MAG: hypothetical protein N3B21_14190 [Clostridia bacterium]|nr:hypothetical protein [Clostridia bacterium]
MFNSDKRIFRSLDLSEYSDCRNYVTTLVILNCGCSINQLPNVMIDNYSSKDTTTKINSGTAKTREAKISLNSFGTTKHLQRVVHITKANHKDYIFNSIYMAQTYTIYNERNFRKDENSQGLRTSKQLPKSTEGYLLGMVLPFLP